jgi:cytochrome b6-f complex iron-sulfur subunit
MSLGVRIGVWLASAWVRLYTLGLPAPVAGERRELIESDVWEQAHDEPGPAASIVLRVLLGAPDDLIWRCVDARRQSKVLVFEEVSPVMTDEKSEIAALSLVCGLALALVAVIAVEPFPYSLSVAGSVLAIVALAGWALELRGSPDAGVSVWPPALAAGLAAGAAGFAFDGARAGLIVAAPFAFFSAKAWLEAVNASSNATVVAAPAPLPAAALAARAAAGAAIAYEATPAGVSRRSLLRTTLWLGLGSGLAALGATVVDFLWNRSPEAFGGVVVAGPPGTFPPGSKTHVLEGKFWLVSLTQEQGGPGFLALWHKCPHLGCTVPWAPDFSYTDAETGESKKGWFRCPCHQSTYNDAGVRVYGPAPRSMDRMEVSFDHDTGKLSVNTGKITKGAPDNARHALKVDIQG